MKYILLFVSIGIFLSYASYAHPTEEHKAASAQDAYRISIDLAGCKDDKVKVTVIPPELSGKNFTYIIPRSVPGTYSKDDYGRFVMDAKAWDKGGHELGISRDDNDIVINGKPARLEYWVRDTWDDPEGGEVFQPTGSNIQQDTNFLINTHCFFGYFEGYKLIPYQITVNKPKGFYGATSLDKKEVGTNDILTAQSYPHLVDNPIMYCLPDTVSFYERGTKVMVAVFSPNKRISADVVAKDLKPTISALGKFLGTMPVDHYTFIIYFAGHNQHDIQKNFAFGALEHSYSSCYFLPEGKGSDDGTIGMISSTAAHEFLHILVPLNLHSKEVHDFDFKNPKMSQHLWLYEGCTEYFSVLARAQDTLLTEKEFFREINQKMKTTSALLHTKPLSLVTLSKRVLEPEYQKLYPIIYEKGAVAGFLLDIRIRELTNGTMDLLGMIRKLTEKYGPHHPFTDDELFAEIRTIVHPDIKQFFDDYIIGDKELPYEEYFTKLGYSYKESDSAKVYQFSKANIFFQREATDAVVLRSRSENDFGVKDNDTLVRINDILVTPENKFEMFGMYIWAPSGDKPVTLSIRRGNEELKLSATPIIKMKEMRNVITPLEAPTPQQITLRKALLKKDA